MTRLFETCCLKVCQFLVFSCLSVAATCLAEEVQDLYSATVTVADQTIASRNRAASQGFIQVIEKLTGSSGVAQSQPVLNAALQSDRYIVGYSYRRKPAKEPNQPDQLEIALQFSQINIDNFLRVEQLPIWPAERQPLLVWVVIDDPVSGRLLAMPDQYPEIYTVLQEVAERRGQPIKLPILDLQDRLTLKPDDVWYFNGEQLQAAAERYQVAHWLVVRIFQTSQGDWRGSSGLGSESGTRISNFDAPEISQFIGNIVDTSVDRFASEFVYIPQQSNDRLELVFTGVNEHRQYLNLSNFLRDLEIVTDWQLKSIDNQSLHILVAIEGEPALFYAALNRNRKLQALEGEGTYRWMDSASR